MVDLEALVAAAGPDGLAVVLPYLTNSNRQTRQQALTTVIQFDDRSVIPRLQQLAANTPDPAERSNLLAAADYLNLPTPTEYFAAHGTNSAAKIITHPRTFGKRPVTPDSPPQPPTATQ